jgi:hypothetical protein
MVKFNEYGVVSHNNSKNMACSNLGHYLNKVGALKLRSKQLIKELDGFIKKNGKNNNWSWSKSGGIGSYDDLVDALIWALLLVHQKLVETCFILDGPVKYDKYAKPVKIAREIIGNISDPRKYQKTMLINQQKNPTPIYFGNNGMPLEVMEDIDDVSWLLEL